jgi:SAM-dependent methyltransferase
VTEQLSTINRAAPRAPCVGDVESAIPSYLHQVYTWAYLNPRHLALLDNPVIVSAILFGNYHRLRAAAFGELHPGQRVLQPACVYGDFSPSLAAHLGPDGHLDVFDIVPMQVENCRRKLAAFPHAQAWHGDAAELGGGGYDAVCCFFLLHEMPEAYKAKVADALLDSVRPGGKVVFVDYHRPHRAHPLKPIMSLVFDSLEPFAKDLWDSEIPGYARHPAQFDWSKRTYFGGLYQMTVARHRAGN